MEPASDFRELIRRVRAGDERAAAELVGRYEPEIRREVRVRLDRAGLRRLLDTTDITQSVLGNFFVRAALGQFDLDEPGQLLRLLVKMTQNHLVDWNRRLRADRRDLSRDVSLDAHLQSGWEPAAPTPTASLSAAHLLEQVRGRLTADERLIADRRAAGYGWAEIARETGGSAEALRKTLSRALDRVARELGLGELPYT